eukprot:8332479-Pyramimonas_sp.AAC.2
MTSSLRRAARARLVSVPIGATWRTPVGRREAGRTPDGEVLVPEIRDRHVAGRVRDDQWELRVENRHLAHAPRARLLLSERIRRH